MVKNHGFVDGNKRTTLVTVVLLIERSNYTLLSAPDLDENEEFYVMLKMAADSTFRYPEILEWFEGRIVRS